MPVSTYVLIALYALAAAGMSIASAHLVHILQLEGYKNKNLMRWAKGNLSKLLLFPAIASLCGAALTLLVNIIFTVRMAAHDISMALIALVYIVLMMVYAKLSSGRKAKKPLVITSRVKRLFGFIALFYLMLAGGLLALDYVLLQRSVFGGFVFFFIMLFKIGRAHV